MKTIWIKDSDNHSLCVIWVKSIKKERSYILKTLTHFPTAVSVDSSNGYRYTPSDIYAGRSGIKCKDAGYKS